MNPKVKFIPAFISLCLLKPATSSSQTALQTVRGKVTDKENHQPLPFVSAGIFSDSSLVKAAATDENGNFRLTEIPVGRYSLRLNFIGYEPAVISDIIVNSGKEFIVNAELEQRVHALVEVEVKGLRKNETVNEMALTSARMFSVDETNRYAGSRSDPGRMASNFAGVTGSDDSRNDVVIRGNSPLGVLWRINGIDVPNPNHFAVAGTTGGGVSMINTKVLDNSDFLTGAFPAEYGNTVAGVIDLKFRNGNNEKNESTAQFGFLGTELSSEGPLSKDHTSSYLFAYRYSTLKLFESLKIKIGTDAIPNYQDLSFRLNFPSARGGSFSVFGLGGISRIAILVSTYTQPATELYGEKNKDQYFGSSQGLIGISKTAVLSTNTFAGITLSYQKAKTYDTDKLVYRNSDYQVDSIIPCLGYTFLTGILSANFLLNKKFNPSLSMRTGILINRLDFNLTDSTLNTASYNFTDRLNYTGNTFLIQPYVQFKYKVTDQLVLNGGLHGQFLTLNNSRSVEPRFGIKWNFRDNQSLSAGTGLHSEMQPYYIYFQQVKNADGVPVQQNHDLSFTRSIHFVFGYDRSLNTNSRIKIETYYMHLYEVPIGIHSSSYSILNEGASFDRFFPDSLTNKGTGRNYGVEFTYEKFFSHTYFAMLTASLYDSKYTGSDGIERNTSFNGKYAFNLLGGKEFQLGKKHATTLSTGIKLTEAGGQRYTPVDTAASHRSGDIVETDSLRNTKQFHGYFRLDLRISLKMNRKKVTHEFSLDLVNVLNTKNVLSLIYVYDPGHPYQDPIREEYQLGFLPLFSYKIDF